MPRRRRIIVGISGASGAIYGIRLLESLEVAGVETHLIVSPDAERTILTETRYNMEQVCGLASVNYEHSNVGGAVASGSFLSDGMVIAPCSIKTMSAVAHSYNDNLLVRAADVCLKENRKLVLMVRETPLHLGHLRLLTELAETGAVILPPMPAFYHLPQSIEDIVNQTVGKVLDQFGVRHDLFRRWNGEVAEEQRTVKPQLIKGWKVK
ncbi:3-octaprenyl-4-hydroxybenzoate carboxy-lyase partner protein [Peptococcaceae bacterium CEB3]|nr:3-octaprenyl-4-hydroxybenzoate carboxy-lyase partner protein [Peptococcaceae bacterium CEB3]